MRKCNEEVISSLYLFLSENPDLMVEIEGHADQIGSDKYNMELGMKRANEVRGRLIKMGISEDRIVKIESKGKREPVCNTLDPQCRKRNRRVVIKFI